MGNGATLFFCLVSEGGAAHAGPWDAAHSYAVARKDVDRKVHVIHGRDNGAETALLSPHQNSRHDPAHPHLGGTSIAAGN